MVRDYPEDETLERIRTWEVKSDMDCLELADFVCEHWWMGCNEPTPDGKWEFSTYGWSGNEDIVEAMQKNQIFWMFCFEKHSRGGHFELNVKPTARKA